MIYKVLPITCYPSSLGNSYNCTITDERQSNVTTTMQNSIVYLYDLNKANHTSVENNNTVTVFASKSSGNNTLVGYEYTTNNNTTTKQLASVTSTTVKIQNFRDPGAKIVFYGGGVGTINGSDFSKSFTIGGKTLTVSGVYTIANNNSNSFTTTINFNYPMSSTIYKVKVNYSGNNNVESYENWSVGWRVSTAGGVSGSGTNTSDNTGSSGRATIQRPYNSDSPSDPKAVIRLAYLTADYSFNIGGHQVLKGAEVNKNGFGTPTGVTGYSEPYGSGETRFVVYGEYEGEEGGGNYYLLYDADYYGRGDVYVSKDCCDPWYGYAGGTNYEGQIRYQYNQSPDWWVEQWEP